MAKKSKNVVSVAKEAKLSTKEKKSKVEVKKVEEPKKVEVKEEVEKPKSVLTEIPRDNALIREKIKELADLLREVGKTKGRSARRYVTQANKLQSLITRRVFD